MSELLKMIKKDQDDYYRDESDYYRREMPYARNSEYSSDHINTTGTVMVEGHLEGTISCTGKVVAPSISPDAKIDNGAQDTYVYNKNLSILQYQKHKKSKLVPKQKNLVSLREDKYTYDGKPPITRGLSLLLSEETNSEIAKEETAPPKNTCFEFSLPSADIIKAQDFNPERSDHIFPWGRDAQDINAQAILHYKSQVIRARSDVKIKLSMAVRGIKSELQNESPVYVRGFLRSIFNLFGVETVSKKCRFERIADHFSNLIDAMGEDIEACQTIMTIAENGKEQMPDILTRLQTYRNTLNDHYKKYENDAQAGDTTRDEEVVDRLKSRRENLDESIERNEIAHAGFQSMIKQQETYIGTIDALRSKIMNGFMAQIETALTIEKAQQSVTLSALKQIDTIASLISDIETLTKESIETLSLENGDNPALLLEHKQTTPVLALPAPK